MSDKDQEKEKVQDSSETNEQQTEDSSASSDAPSDKKTAELEAKVAELNDKYLRLYSEFDNYRKRTSREKIELAQTAGEDLFRSLLPVLDDFERAIRSISDAKDISAVQDGVQLIYNKFKSTLSAKGLQEMKAQGETFDADVHEAITNIPAPSEDQKGKVIEELEKGYTLNGKIIRFAKVVIGQ